MEICTVRISGYGNLHLQGSPLRGPVEGPPNLRARQRCAKGEGVMIRRKRDLPHVVRPIIAFVLRCRSLHQPGQGLGRGHNRIQMARGSGGEAPRMQRVRGTQHPRDARCAGGRQPPCLKVESFSVPAARLMLG